METDKNQVNESIQLTIQDKIQKLIENFASLKEKYNSLKEEHQTTLKANIELEEDKALWQNEKVLLEQKVNHLTEEIRSKMIEINELKDKNNEYDNFTKTAALKIDDLLSNVDFEV